MVAQVRRALGVRQVGHAGTLDPFATGLLVVLVGRATRLARFVEAGRKGYLATAVLGVVTDTDDRDGEVRRTVAPPAWPDRARVADALAALVGTHPQVPPAYSARRVAGRRGYELARRGEEVALPAREVTVHRMELVAWEAPRLTFRTEVSPGTYVRALARDLGESLGTGAHLDALRREWIGAHRVEDAIAPETVGHGTALLAPLDLVPDLPRVDVSPAEAEAVGHGRPVARFGARGEAALVHDGRLLAVAEGGEDGWQPRVVLEAA